MANIDDVSLKIGKLESSVSSLEKELTKELHAINKNMSIALERMSENSKKADRAHDRIDLLETSVLANVKVTADKAYEWGQDYNDNKKKAIFGAGLLIALGAGLKWLFAFIH